MHFYFYLIKINKSDNNSTNTECREKVSADSRKFRENASRIYLFM
jgi:hypothetical protein